MAEVGRPAHYTTPGDLQAKVEEYFADPDTNPTVTGLAYHLGFESRQSLYDYEQKGEFSYIIKRAKLRVEMSYEDNLRGNNAAGPIFALKNMGWKDTQRTELSGPDGGPIQLPVINVNVLKPGEYETKHSG